MNPSAGSITRLIPELRQRDERAILLLWKRYGMQIENLARPWLIGVSPGVGDAEDVAQSASTPSAALRLKVAPRNWPTAMIFGGCWRPFRVIRRPIASVVSCVCVAAARRHLQSGIGKRGRR